MSFHEHVVGRGSSPPEPLWVCRCGIEVKVRVLLLPHRPAPSGLSTQAQLRIASLRELRETLTLVRMRARAQRERAISLRDRARVAVADAQQSLAISAVVLDNNARHLAVSPVATVLTGYSEAELMRMSVWDLTSVPRNGRGERAWLQLINRGSRSGICLLRRTGGDAISVRYAAVANILPGVHAAAMAPREPLP